MEAGWIHEIHPVKPYEEEDKPHDSRLDLPPGTLKLLFVMMLLEPRVDDDVI